jgi:hypothetical protein
MGVGPSAPNEAGQVALPLNKFMFLKSLVRVEAGTNALSEKASSKSQHFCLEVASVSQQKGTLSRTAEEELHRLPAGS